ncbi:YybH family protein [Enterovirga rhinocerotis]|uniref:Ketosteroid isomerase-like protein n=1 Tax=Enterovirga rhinocerotis TaxID=1339210 RepID=A0A4V3DX35_9HYPH|nr:nuclear transport factor 2 family protein [Enterovirga rhinocerotis]TDR87169.1 ketosteroid isomerase-like protein [Enterovirga rhinocerotis]
MVQPISEAITGAEPNDDPGTPEGALTEFYRAFNERDAELMARNWIDGDEAAMDNPLGGIKRGWNEIRQVYERIFGGRARVRVAFHDYTLHLAGESFLAVGRERGTFKTDDTELCLAIRTSRWFRLVDGRWRQIHHHGSIEDPELLARYQAAVR